MPENKLGYNQASKYTAAIAEVFYDVMETRRPADRLLRNYFSNNKQCGSKDRRFIAEGLYSLFRWFGWSRDLMPEEKPEIAFESNGFCESLLISLNIEDLTTSPAYIALCQKFDYKPQQFSESVEEKVEQLAEIMGAPKRLEELVPNWFLSAVNSPEPKFFEGLQKRPPVWIRTQNNKNAQVIRELEKKGISYDVSPKVDKALKILGKVNLTALQSFRQGFFEVQDLASQVLVSVCRVESNQKWWDVCAGGGGKTLALADQLLGQGSVVATDKRKEVLQEVKKRSRRGGFRNVILANLQKEMKSTQLYDGVLVDAPCSCTGTWRRNPDARWTREEDVCQKWARVQFQILEDICTKVKKGGTLVYATCSSSFIENEQVVKKFLESNTEFELDAIIHPLTGEMTSGMVSVDALPEDCDSMFAARMIRKKK